MRKPEHIIFSDASAYAGAGFIDESILKVAHFMFTEDEKLKSSTWRELKTVLFILQSLQSIIFILINHNQNFNPVLTEVGITRGMSHEFLSHTHIHK
jgi:hypothetical protein